MPGDPRPDVLLQMLRERAKLERILPGLGRVVTSEQLSSFGGVKIADIGQVLKGTGELSIDLWLL